MVRFASAFMAALAFTACSHAASAASAVPANIDTALKDAGRPPSEMMMDAVRKPADILSFAGVKPGQVVDEFIPGDAYLTRILSKAVGPKGHLYAHVPFAGAINAETIRREQKDVHQPVDDVLALQNMIHYRNNLTVIWQFIGLDGGAFGLPYQADVIVTTNYPTLHVEKKTDTKDLTGPLKEMFDSVKPGGVFVVSGATAAKGAGFTAAETLNRVEPDAVKKELTAIGYTFDGESQALANASDDHTGVAAAGDKSDRFLLRFKKPANAAPDMRAQGKEWAKVLYGNTWVSALNSPSGGRRLFYHTDDSYEEWGVSGSLVQEGYWFLDAKARVCILHEFPAVERGYIICSKKLPVKVGDRWETMGRPPRGPSTNMVQPGRVYFESQVPGQPPGTQQ